MTARESEGQGAPGLSKAEAQRRVAEILASQEDSGKGPDRTRRTRTLLVIVLVLLLLLLCGIGVFTYRLLVPQADLGAGTDTGNDATNGIVWIRSIYGIGPAADQLFVNPNDAVTGSDGTIWIADPGGYRVVGVRGDGSLVNVIQGDKQTGEPFRTAARLAVDSDGVLYIVDRANQMLTLMDGQTKLTSSSIPGITCVDANDTIVVVGSDSGFAILDKDGNVQTITGTRGRGDDQFDSVGGVAIDSASETIYVVDTYNNRLSAWDYAGTRKWMVQLGNPGNDVQLQGGGSLETTSAAPAGLQLPTDVTVDGNGRPMVLDAFDFTISAFQPADGTFVGKWGGYGDKDGQFMYPSGFDYDPAADWFTVADTGNLRAQIIRIEGTAPGGTAAVRSGLTRFMSGPARALWPCLTLLPLLLLLLLLARFNKRRKERKLERDARQRSVSGEPALRSSDSEKES